MFWEENAQKTNYMSESGTKKNDIFANLKK